MTPAYQQKLLDEIEQTLNSMNKEEFFSALDNCKSGPTYEEIIKLNSSKVLDNIELV